MSKAKLRKYQGVFTVKSPEKNKTSSVKMGHLHDLFCLVLYRPMGGSCRFEPPTPHGLQINFAHKIAISNRSIDYSCWAYYNLDFNHSVFQSLCTLVYNQYIAHFNFVNSCSLALGNPFCHSMPPHCKRRGTTGDNSG